MRKILKISATLACLLTSSQFSLAADFSASGSIIPKDAKDATFDWNLDLKDTGSAISIQSKFTNKATGKVDTTETTKWENREFSLYEFKRLNSSEYARLEKKNNKYYMSYTKDGKTKQTEFDGDENLVAGPMVMLEIYKNWDELVNGKDVRINFAAIDHQRSVGFDLKLKEKNESGFTFAMVPSSFLIAMFVDTLHFKYKSKEEIPSEIIGRVLPVNMKEGTIVPIDGSFITAKSNVNVKNLVKM